MDQQSRPIQVAAVGMDERMRNALRLYFKVPCNNLCVLVEEDSAEIGIIDLDAYRGQKICDEYRNRHPDQPVILLSLHDTEVEDGVFLRKPLNAKHLISALIEAKQRLQPRIEQPAQVAESKPAASVPTKIREQGRDHPPEGVVEERKRKREKAAAPATHHAAMCLGEQNAKVLISTVPDIDPEDPQLLAKAQYDPNEFLQGHIYCARKIADDRNRCVRLDTSRGSIYLFPDGHGAKLRINETRLRTLSIVPVIENSLSVSVLEIGYTLGQDDDSSIIDRDALLWKTALWASRGRVPAGTSLDTPVFLKRWPNMTRLLLFPHALRIAALWVDQPRSLLDTAETLNIPQRHVFGFYSAAHALGLAATSQRAVDTLIEPAPLQKNSRRGLFGSIVNRLREH